MSEYVRALKLQKENVDDALSLFSELLETEVLFEVSSTLISENTLFLCIFLWKLCSGDKITHFEIIDFDQIQLL